MAYSIACSYTVKVVSAAGAAGGDGREHALLEPVGGDGMPANGGPMKVVLNTIGNQGKMVVGDTVTVTISK